MYLIARWSPLKGPENAIGNQTNTARETSIRRGGAHMGFPEWCVVLDWTKLSDSVSRSEWPYIVTGYFIPSFINRLAGHVYRSTSTAAAMIIISFRGTTTTTNKKRNTSGEQKGPQTKQKTNKQKTKDIWWTKRSPNTRTHRRDYTDPRRWS